MKVRSLCNSRVIRSQVEADSLFIPYSSVLVFKKDLGEIKLREMRKTEEFLALAEAYITVSWPTLRKPSVALGSRQWVISTSVSVVLHLTIDIA